MNSSRSRAKETRSRSVLSKTGNALLDTYKVGNSVYHITRGNFRPLASLAVDKLTSTPKIRGSGMAPRRMKARGRNKRQRRKRRIPASLRPTTFHIRHIVPYSATEGSQHRWYYTFRKNWLLSSFLRTFDEFRISSLTIRYVPNNSTNETGLYTGVLLDRGGFGSYGSATASQWFANIGSMPGSKIRPRFVSSVYRWKPTEPSVRDWVATDKDINYCTVYVCNNGKETDELGGLFDVSAVVQARGLYYNAAVKMYHEEKRKYLSSTVPSGTDDQDAMHLSSPFNNICGLEDSVPRDDLY